MKSVFKTFSQSTLNVMTKVCLTALCVFVLSSVGSAQSFIKAQDAVQVLKPVVGELQTEWNATNQGARVIPESTDELYVRYLYFASLKKSFDGSKGQLPVETVIGKNHYKIASKLNAVETPSALLEQLKQEATNLLTN